MHLRSNRFFTYPVLGDSAGSFKSGSFSTTAICTIQGSSIKVDFTSSLTNDVIENLLSKGKATIVHHIECPATCFRTAIKTQDSQAVLIVKTSEISGELQICSFIIAQDPIENYENPDFSDDYIGFTFNLEKGTILALGDEYSIQIDKNYDEVNFGASIFSIVPKRDKPDEHFLSFDTTKEKIVISIPEQEYLVYVKRSRQIAMQPSLNSMIIIPVLSIILTKIQENSEYEDSDRRWFRSLRKTCETRFNINFDSDEFKSTDAFALAQSILDYPIQDALDLLEDKEEEDIEE